METVIVQGGVAVIAMAVFAEGVVKILRAVQRARNGGTPSKLLATVDDETLAERKVTNERLRHLEELLGGVVIHEERLAVHTVSHEEKAAVRHDEVMRNMKRIDTILARIPPPGAAPGTA